MDKEALIEKRYVFTEGIIKVRDDIVILPNGKTTKRNVVEHCGGCAILIVDKKDNSAYFVRQYRYALEKELLELPAGKLEIGENHFQTAMRESQEEVGILPINLHYLGYFYPTCGYSNEIIHLYYTEDYTLNKLSLDDDEFLEPLKIRLDDAYRMIYDGTITDGKTIVALLKYKELNNE